ncbi:hypothetical protein SpiGrapes_2356 [Sphaerochaeta pleomorpha str. Grapes]|uniref:DUF72 domain-containing protein n=1 Tax=Sphaerochaeta pleomorpha (strain ATCC BAA-1885 / DSM 22778 / Grapes) TaxID=158190 RepID=G8QSU8_SPHPG|nr:DUF72 domain-containing protein [Sphaerochaeta pleomorpha]AEV30130.1 hypothetical protein SpiGrapes_2356 [Sphaerochaeta pleomorpha str. Grapes]
MENLYIGSCSWKYPSWEKLVYSSREPTDFLAEYAQKYRSVEIDQWFWSLGKSSYGLPDRATVAQYNASTPSDFRFTIKCPNTLTVPYAYKSGTEPNPWFLDREVFSRFLDTLEGLLPKIGLFIFQFEYLNKEKMESREKFLAELDAFFNSLPPSLPYGCEIRNPRWLDAFWFDFLRSHHIGPVLLQGYWMDDISQVLQRYANRIGPVACIRLHGDDRKGIEQETGGDWSKIVTPRDEELERIAAYVSKLAETATALYINVNSHYEGSAPLTIAKLQLLLEQQQ